MPHAWEVTMVRGWNPEHRIVIPERAAAQFNTSRPRGRCAVARCARSTNGSKPYCVEHIDQMPYVAGMSKRERRRPR